MYCDFSATLFGRTPHQPHQRNHSQEHVHHETEIIIEAHHGGLLLDHAEHHGGGLLGRERRVAGIHHHTVLHVVHHVHGRSVVSCDPCAQTVGVDLGMALEQSIGDGDADAGAD